MFETGMSALVLKICGEYAKALGLNFPPCVQQEINAIAQYVDLHTLKDLKVEQDGSVVTITCFTEGEQEKVFTVTQPEVNVDVLFNLIKGSSSVVVDKSEDGTHLVVQLDKSQEVQSIRIYDPQVPLTAEQLAILKANQENYILLYGSSIYKLQSAYVRDENTCVYSAADLSYSGVVGITNVVVNMSNGEWSIESTNLQNSGGGKLYLHVYKRDIPVEGDPKNTVNSVYYMFYSTSSTKLSGSEFKKIFDKNSVLLFSCTIGGAYINYCTQQQASMSYAEPNDYLFFIPDIFNPVNTLTPLSVPDDILYNDLTASIIEV